MENPLLLCCVGAPFVFLYLLQAYTCFNKQVQNWTSCRAHKSSFVSLARLEVSTSFRSDRFYICQFWVSQQSFVTLEVSTGVVSFSSHNVNGCRAACVISSVSLMDSIPETFRHDLGSWKNRGRPKGGPQILVYIYIYMYMEIQPE